jgi:hypothetical protein
MFGERVKLVDRRGIVLGWVTDETPWGLGGETPNRGGLRGRRPLIIKKISL